jgi:hypothetical protein
MVQVVFILAFAAFLLMLHRMRADEGEAVRRPAVRREPRSSPSFEPRDVVDAEWEELPGEGNSPGRHAEVGP